MNDIEQFITQVEEMRQTQKDFYASKDRDWDVRKILLAESKAAEYMVDKSIERHREEIEGQTNLFDQIDDEPVSEKGSQND